MIFSELGGYIQTGIQSEGDVLWRAGMLDKIWKDGRAIGYDPSKRLRSLFIVMPPLEETYPVLIEFVCYWRNRHWPGFVNYPEVCRQLGALSMTKGGLELLERLVVEIVGSRAHTTG